MTTTVDAQAQPATAAPNTATPVREVLSRLDEPCHVTQDGDRLAIVTAPAPGARVLAVLPPCVPRALGSAAFRYAHGVRLAYVAGGMAHGIASVKLVRAMADAGLLAAFGAGGLRLSDLERAAVELTASRGQRPFLMNLLHSPQDPQAEARTVEIYLQHRVRGIEASAFMDITPALVRYRVSGLTRDSRGMAISNRVVAKVSRLEVGRKFMSPPPREMVSALLQSGHITEEQADLSRHVPLADDITVEADSGGHTDSRPLTVLLPVFIEERQRLRRQWQPSGSVRLGAAGGIGTPYAAAAALALGADYVVTGSVNQLSTEAAVSAEAKDLLRKASSTDFALAPAADMFEIGAQVQVLKRGTLFAQKARRLRELFNRYDAVDHLPAADREWLENQVLRRSLEEAWRDVADYLARQQPAALTRANSDPHAKMALIFRWYLGLSSRWAQDGEPGRVADYQLWAGPALGAFNAWVAAAGLTYLERPAVIDIAAAMMWGAAYAMRVTQLRTLGFAVPADAALVRPPRDAVTHLGRQTG